ncbi:hypothetical protein B0H19DRAFT_1337519 [Mycena capillaripes]|nr:hypothetical protein B0H19DRAFT_1337519 [Mycena capillaripes]
MKGLLKIHSGSPRQNFEQAAFKYNNYIAIRDGFAVSFANFGEPEMSPTGSRKRGALQWLRLRKFNRVVGSVGRFWKVGAPLSAASFSVLSIQTASLVSECVCVEQLRQHGVKQQDQRVHLVGFPQNRTVRLRPEFRPKTAEEAAVAVSFPRFLQAPQMFRHHPMLAASWILAVEGDHLEAGCSHVVGDAGKGIGRWGARPGKSKAGAGLLKKGGGDVEVSTNQLGREFAGDPRPGLILVARIGFKPGARINTSSHTYSGSTARMRRTALVIFRLRLTEGVQDGGNRSGGRMKDTRARGRENRGGGRQSDTQTRAMTTPGGCRGGGGRHNEHGAAGAEGA